MNSCLFNYRNSYEPYPYYSHQNYGYTGYTYLPSQTQISYPSYPYRNSDYPTRPQLSYSYPQQMTTPSTNSQFLVPSQPHDPYPYSYEKYNSPQNLTYLWREPEPMIPSQGLETLLIAILVLTALDMLFVRPRR
ncbi:hypothetical protein Desdi_2379 [Desulfitobacterium dichloroeliminans LMG P-21439]|uniref:Uncharacterized protein n=1 Tax=Desulfitobacterium dichloroeliminans (strain LMG P-21439 / DCA1) TaxID=871963 RepID=L0FA28_DESDL|nr:hypothetical protein [Desulfitobacterium dichloroeliminans]AGA69803.1 hypothetical protein Desdi_2379 [Desulfitobacterium dichloroeliminans LMG P-21439]